MSPSPPLDREAFLRPIAHRGLHHAATGRIENSGPAFKAAIARGYGIECDLRPLADGTPIVFHDETLDRLVNPTVFPLSPRLEGRGEGAAPNHPTLVSTIAPAGLAQLHYRGTGDPILTFADLLDLVAGTVPLLVEIKSEWTPPSATFLDQIATLANAYRGPIALMSFDPAVLAPLKALSPAIPRGLVSGSYRASNGDDWWADNLTHARAAELRDLADIDALNAGFCAYEVAALPTPETQALRARSIPVFTWTVRTPADRATAAQHADAPIFEGFEP